MRWRPVPHKIPIGLNLAAAGEYVGKRDGLEAKTIPQQLIEENAHVEDRPQVSIRGDRGLSRPW